MEELFLSYDSNSFGFLGWGGVGEGGLPISPISPIFLLFSKALSHLGLSYILRCHSQLVGTEAMSSLPPPRYLCKQVLISLAWLKTSSSCTYLVALFSLQFPPPLATQSVQHSLTHDSSLVSIFMLAKGMVSFCFSLPSLVSQQEAP